MKRTLILGALLLALAGCSYLAPEPTWETEIYEVYAITQGGLCVEFDVELVCIPNSSYPDRYTPDTTAYQIDWTVDDGITVRGAPVLYTYGQPGSHNVTVTVMDCVGQTVKYTFRADVDYGVSCWQACDGYWTCVWE